MPEYNNWNIERDEHGIAWLHLDKADSKVNLLSGEVLDELYDLLGELERELPQAIIFLSDKADSFIFGADIQEFTTLDSDEKSQAFLDRGHKVMNKVAAMRCKTLSMIHGMCLGGGTELSLACDYIVASDDRKTRIGLPEIKLGIHPGYGGTARSIRRMGAPAAMNIMLTGRALPARSAKKLGLIDECVPLRQLKNAAIHRVLNAPQTRRAKGYLRALNHGLLRPLVASQMRKQVARKARAEHYPAPYALIDLWQRYGGNEERMLREEAISVARLATNDTARNLVRVFFLQEALKREGKQLRYKPAHVHVIGGGIMGGDIAAWCAIQGYTVSVQDTDTERLAQMVKRANQSFGKKFKRDRRAIRDANDRLMPDHKGHGIARADLVIEAIFENLDAKQALYRDIEPKMKSDAILATNTSSIMLEALCSCLQKPERLVGLHFFNPVAMMPLVEVIHGEQTDATVMQQALAFTQSIGKLPLPTKSSPGFLVNRILMPYLLEAVTLLGEGVQAELIDKAATDFGMPMGPIELADTVGLDVCRSVADILSKALGTDLPANLDQMVAGGKLGKKSGAGFYQWNKGKAVKQKVRDKSQLQHVQERMIMRLLNEAVACYREKIVASDELIDAGVIFGTGFAPFRGGPIHHIRDAGVEPLHMALQALQDRHGERFQPDAGWQDL